jgi:L-ascorbate metabolism protein UlaG (beta-lactamase superfamily)
VTFDWGWVKLVPAWHTSTTPNGTVSTPAGLLIHLGGKLVYHLGDTALFSDLQLIGRRGNRVDVALVPIGGHFTMDRFDAVTAVELVQPFQVIPCHYDTFPPIETDAQAFKADVEAATDSKVVVLAPGETYTVQ